VSEQERTRFFFEKEKQKTSFKRGPLQRRCLNPRLKKIFAAAACVGLFSKSAYSFPS
jgi:hypothetical protein